MPEVIRVFKTFAARKINEMRVSTSTPVSQPGFHDHLIRGEGELDRVRAYIMDNPGKWFKDGTTLPTGEAGGGFETRHYDMNCRGLAANFVLELPGLTCSGGYF